MGHTFEHGGSINLPDETGELPFMIWGPRTQISPDSFLRREAPVLGSMILSSELRTTVPHEPDLISYGSFAKAKHMEIAPASVIPYPCLYVIMHAQHADFNIQLMMFICALIYDILLCVYMSLLLFDQWFPAHCFENNIAFIHNVVNSRDLWQMVRPRSAVVCKILIYCLFERPMNVWHGAYGNLQPTLINSYSCY